MLTRTCAALGLAAAAAACGSPEVPETPTFTEHVRPILVANCARCHATPVIGGAYAFDVRSYDDVANPINLPAVETVILNGTMPPTTELDAWEIDVILAWIDAGAPR